MEARAVPDAELGHGVERLPIPVPFPLPPANVTFVDGAVPTLFDTACGDEAGWATLQHTAKERGIDLARIERVVLTHGHLDHAGNAARLKALSGAEVCIHAGDAAVLAQWDERHEPRNAAYEAGLRRAGLPERLLERLAVEGRRVDDLMRSCPVDRVLQDGDRLEAGDRSFRVVHTPGHTAGSAIFMDADAGISITGDTVLQNITPNALSVQREESGALARYLATLARLRDLPLGAMVPGHGPVFRGVAPVVDRALRLYHRRRQRVVGFLQEAARPLSVWDIVEHEWPERRGSAFLMTSEIQGHLDVLVADGLVTVTEPEDRTDGGTTALYRFQRKD